MVVSAKDRGKSAEGLLKDYLEKRSRQQSFAHMRLPDAHAGSLVATLADFMVLQDGRFQLIECKSTRQEHRLPHANFDTGQVARMRIWQLAGANCFVMIYHEMLGLWRSYSLDYFVTRTGGSWNLRDTEPTTLEKAFENYAFNSPK